MSDLGSEGFPTGLAAEFSGPEAQEAAKVIQATFRKQRRAPSPRPASRSHRASIASSHRPLCTPAERRLSVGPLQQLSRAPSAPLAPAAATVLSRTLSTASAGAQEGAAVSATRSARLYPADRTISSGPDPSPAAAAESPVDVWPSEAGRERIADREGQLRVAERALRTARSERQLALQEAARWRSIAEDAQRRERAERAEHEELVQQLRVELAAAQAELAARCPGGRGSAASSPRAQRSSTAAQRQSTAGHREQQSPCSPDPVVNLHSGAAPGGARARSRRLSVAESFTNSMKCSVLCLQPGESQAPYLRRISMAASPGAVSMPDCRSPQSQPDEKGSCSGDPRPSSPSFGYGYRTPPPGGRKHAAERIAAYRAESIAMERAQYWELQPCQPPHAKAEQLEGTSGSSVS
eukprot:TRINITY_DN10655_c0_g1_i1.p1 TRINITY_DN10655_c0_g1~~TRINITY_DN10655_c0_g1_i1.p1  ORF type:complete len:434 (+),score=107.23 TRINITY_DN10655_c0_g1_i1:73-1302(+)